MNNDDFYYISPAIYRRDLLYASTYNSCSSCAGLCTDACMYLCYTGSCSGMCKGSSGNTACGGDCHVTCYSDMCRSGCYGRCAGLATDIFTIPKEFNIYA